MVRLQMWLQGQCALPIRSAPTCKTLEKFALREVTSARSTALSLRVALLVIDCQSACTISRSQMPARILQVILMRGGITTNASMLRHAFVVRRAKKLTIAQRKLVEERNRSCTIKTPKGLTIIPTFQTPAPPRASNRTRIGTSFSPKVGSM